jgi:F0F1-type ATP synthase assembly protein I
MDGPFNSLPPEVRMNLALQCNSEACIAARNKVVNARNDAVAACSDVKRLESSRAVYATILGVLVGALISAVVAAFTAPWPFNLIAWIVAALLSIAVGIMIGLVVDVSIKLSRATAALATAIQSFKDAVAEFQTNCNGFCPPIDLTVPTCL